MHLTVILPVTEISQAGEVRRTAAALAARLGLRDTEEGRLAIIATELAGNLARHAERGACLLRPVQEGERIGLELIALDHGPGMANVERCLEDGYSTAGTPGTGLGAVSRQADYFDIYSLAGKGTAVLARVWKGGNRRMKSSRAALGVIHAPKPGEEVSGDGWSIQYDAGRMVLCVADGLGHGAAAATAAQRAVEAFDEVWRQGPVFVLEEAHGRLRSTRGAAVAVADLDRHRRTLTFSGIGNISASVIGPDGRHGMISQNGTIGYEARRIQPFTYEWPEDGLLVMHSDGLSASWNLEKYPGLTERDPGLIAAILYRDCCRGRDDATVVVTRGECP